MSVRNHALRQEPEQFAAKAVTAPGPVPVPALPIPALPIAAGAAGGPAALPPAIGSPRVPSLRVMPLQPANPMRRFARVPTHAVGVFPEQREYPRASLRLPLRLRGIAGRAEDARGTRALAR